MQIRRNRASNLGPGTVRNGGTRFHAGHNLYAPNGTAVRSVMAGTVHATGNSRSYGNYVTVAHEVITENQGMGPFDGPPATTTYYSFYAHLGDVDAQVGDDIESGQQIGTAGTTGNAGGMSGPDEHLYFEAGTELRSANSPFIDRQSTVDPNEMYDGVRFVSDNPSANQSTTGVVKISVDGVFHQYYNFQNPDRELHGRELFYLISRLLTEDQ